MLFTQHFLLQFPWILNPSPFQLHVLSLFPLSHCIHFSCLKVCGCGAIWQSPGNLTAAMFREKNGYPCPSCRQLPIPSSARSRTLWAAPLWGPLLTGCLSTTLLLLRVATVYEPVDSRHCLFPNTCQGLFYVRVTEEKGVNWSEHCAVRAINITASNNLKMCRHRIKMVT